MTDFTRLTRSFPQEQVKERQGKKVNGIPMIFKYVPAHFVVDRLNEFGPAMWNFVIKDSKEYNGEVVVLGSLSINDTVKEAYGSATLTEGKTLGDSYKSASMLSLVKAASLFSIPCVFHVNNLVIINSSTIISISHQTLILKRIMHVWTVGLSLARQKCSFPVSILTLMIIRFFAGSASNSTEIALGE